MKIVVLGGAGKMGCVSVQDLARDRRVKEVVLADRDMAQAKIVAETINSPKVTIQEIDLASHDSLVSVLKGADSCLNAAIYYFNLQAMEASLEMGVPYTDMGGLFHLTRKQWALHDRFAEAGVSAVLCVGTAPGVPNVHARYIAERLDTMEYIHIYDGCKPPPPESRRFGYAVATIIDEITLPPVVFRDGEFVECEPLGEFEDYWFTLPLGLLPMHLSLHSEVATIPITFQDMGVRECFFKINYWGMSKEMVERVRVLVEFGFDSGEEVTINGQKVRPRDMLVAMMSGYTSPITDYLAPPKYQPPDWVEEIVTEVRGTKDGKTITYRLGTLDCKGALLTGMAPARIAIWLAEGRIPAGVYPPEAVVDPIPFFKELEDGNIYTQITVTEAL